MEQAKESRFIGNKKKIPLREILDPNNVQGSSKAQAKKSNLISKRNNYMSPAQALRESNNEKRSDIQQNQQRPKNIWMSSIRDIIRDEPVKVTGVKKPLSQSKQINNKNNSNNSIVRKPSVGNNQSSKPVFTMAPSLKNLMEQQSPKYKNDSNISRASVSPILEGQQSKVGTNSSKPKFALLKAPQEPKKDVTPTTAKKQSTFTVNRSPTIKTSRSPSPMVRQSIQNSMPAKGSPKTHRCLWIFIFLIGLFCSLFLLKFLL